MDNYFVLFLSNSRLIYILVSLNIAISIFTALRFMAIIITIHCAIFMDECH